MKLSGAWQEYHMSTNVMHTKRKVVIDNFMVVLEKLC